MILQACCLKVAFISTWEKTWPFIWRKLNIHFTNIFAKFAWKWPRGSKQNFKMSSMYFAAVTWLKYCQYGLKLHPINQSIIFFLFSPLEKRVWSFIFFNSSPLYPRLLWLWTGLGKQHTYIYILPAFSVLYGLNQFRTCIFLFIPPKMLSTARLCSFT